MNDALLRRDLARDEGCRLKPYKCSEGFLTIAYGFNLDARGVAALSEIIGRNVDLSSLSKDGITQDEADRQIDHDIDMFERDIKRRFPLYFELDEVRQRAVMNFVFNLGTARASAFRNAIRFLKLAVIQIDKDIEEACYTACAFHVMDSLYARQVGDGLGGRFDRADRLAYMIRTGKDK